MLHRLDKPIAGIVIVMVGLLAALLPEADYRRLFVMFALAVAAVLTELLL